jgi:hypothetical protein
MKPCRNTNPYKSPTAAYLHAELVRACSNILLPGVAELQHDLVVIPTRHAYIHQVLLPDEAELQHNLVQIIGRFTFCISMARYELFRVSVLHIYVYMYIYT